MLEGHQDGLCTFDQGYELLKELSLYAEADQTYTSLSIAK